MGHRDDLMLGQIAWLVDAWMSRQIPPCGHHHPAHFADPHRDHRRVLEVRDAERDVDTLVNQVDRPIEQMEPRGHCRVDIHEGIDDRPQQRFPESTVAVSVRVPRGADLSPAAARSPSSSSVRIRRQMTAWRSPASLILSERVVRCSYSTPMRASRKAMARLSAAGERPSRRPVPARLPSSSAMTKTFMASMRSTILLPPGILARKN